MKLGQRAPLAGVWLLCAALAAAAQAPAGQGGSRRPVARWTGPDGQPLPFESDEQVLEFLRTAKATSSTGTVRGITHPQKILLEKNGVRAYAIFHTVNEEKSMVRLKSETVMQFRDSYLFQVAAYELSRLVGLTVLPPSVKRRLHGEAGSVTLWLEGMITDEIRQKENMEPPDPIHWNRQIYSMRVWDDLIFNFDRNQGNFLIDKNWNVWLIDHTRAFRQTDDLPKLEQVRGCDRQLYEGMRALTREKLEQRLRGLLRPAEMTYVLKRRDKIVARLDALIAQQGAEKILFDLQVSAATTRPD